MGKYRLRTYWPTISTFLPSIVEIGPNTKLLFKLLSLFAKNKALSELRTEKERNFMCASVCSVEAAEDQKRVSMVKFSFFFSNPKTVILNEKGHEMPQSCRSIYLFGMLCLLENKRPTTTWAMFIWVTSLFSIFYLEIYFTCAMEAI